MVRLEVVWSAACFVQRFATICDVFVCVLVRLIFMLISVTIGESGHAYKS